MEFPFLSVDVQFTDFLLRNLAPGITMKPDLYNLKTIIDITLTLQKSQRSISKRSGTAVVGADIEVR